MVGLDSFKEFSLFVLVSLDFVIHLRMRLIECWPKESVCFY